MKPVHALTACAAIALCGCSLIPAYKRPDLPVTPAYPSGIAYRATAILRGETAISADEIGWRDFFPDQRLQRLIEIALRNNRDLRVAMLNVAAAQAQYRVQRSDLFPTISLSGAGELGSLPAEAAIPESASGLAQGATGSPTTTIDTGSAHEFYHIYNPGIGFASYELDVFGRLRSLTSEAFEQYLGYGATARSARISLIAEVANAYFAVLTDQSLLRITRETLANEKVSYDLTNAMYKRGSTTMLSLRQAETAVDTALVNQAQYIRQLAQDENALVLLLGGPMPEDLPRRKGITDQGLISNLPPGLPSDLLFQRPDIVAAEHDLIAANANIGAARAAFFPSITLTSNGGLESSQLSRLFTRSALTWSFEPQINIPIFTGGQNEANLDLAKVEKNVQVAQYEKAIQTAFREVSDGLAARTTYIDQVKAERQLVSATADTLHLATLRFQGGVDDYLPVLEAQQSLYTAQQTLLELTEARLVNLATLYKALGGGLHEYSGVPANVADTHS